MLAQHQGAGALGDYEACSWSAEGRGRFRPQEGADPAIGSAPWCAERGIDPPIWRSGNAPGGDEANGQFIAQFKGRVKSL